MKTYTLHNNDGKKYVFNDKQLDELNRAQNRTRVTGGTLDNLILMKSGFIAGETGLMGSEDYVRQMGMWPRLRPCIAQAQKAVDILLEGIEARQFISAYNNFNHVTLTISSFPVDQWTNIRQGDLNLIIRAATANCAATCIRNREQAKRCPLRQALSCVPGMKEAAKSSLNLGGCPYMMIYIPEAEEA